MSRKQRSQLRQIASDPHYGSKTVAKFINYLMISGKKETAERILYGSLENVIQKTQLSAVETLTQILNKSAPLLEVKSRRIGGATYQVPTDVRPRRSTILAMRWILQSARARSENDMQSRLTNEFIDIIEGRGATLRKREEAHKMAEANKVFSSPKRTIDTGV